MKKIAVLGISLIVVVSSAFSSSVVLAVSKTPTKAKVVSVKGSVEKRQYDVYMQGTHYLKKNGKLSYLLKSKKVDLTKYEGKSVTIKGKAKPMVENGGKIKIIEVSSVKIN